MENNLVRQKEDIMIEVNHLSKSYRLYNKPVDRLKESLSIRKKRFSQEHKVLEEIDLQISRGECIGIVGKNGSGKSTLLKMITGIVTPTSGNIKCNGKISALLELGAGFNPEYTGLENIYLNGTMMGYTKEEMDKRVPAIIEFAEIEEFINQPVKTYSSGMFARLAFAVSINVEPDILIVDEALSVGDINFQGKCIEKMKELKKNKTTILFVTHAIEQIKRFCTRAIWIKDGKIVEDGEAGIVTDLFSNYMIYGEPVLNEKEVNSNETFRVPEDKNVVGLIQKVEMNQENYQTFQEMSVKITYDIFSENLKDFSLGVAIYSKDRGNYIFGPNTLLDKKEVPKNFGRHQVIYKISSLNLISGEYAIDVGIFQGDGIVNIDYKNSCCFFKVSNSYFSEGMLYLEHDWEIIQ